MKKICCTCKEEKPVGEFNKRKVSKDGFRGDCKKCQSEYKAKYYLSNKDVIDNRSKKYANENKDKVKEYKKLWNIENSEHIRITNKKYSKKNTDKIKIQHKKDMKNYVDVLNSNYVKQTLYSMVKIPFTLMSEQIIDLKRIQLLIIRELRK